MIPENCFDRTSEKNTKVNVHTPLPSKKVSICRHHLLIVRELRQRRQRRQQERQKKQLVLNWQNNNFSRASRFFSISLPSLSSTTTRWKCLFPSVECKVKDSRRLGMFQSCIRMSGSCFRMSWRFFDIFEFFDLFFFLFIILAKVFYRKHWSNMG